MVSKITPHTQGRLTHLTHPRRPFGFTLHPCACTIGALETLNAPTVLPLLGLFGEVVTGTKCWFQGISLFAPRALIGVAHVDPAFATTAVLRDP